VLGTDPPRSLPSAIVDDPATAWARRVLDTPVLCVRGEGERWVSVTVVPQGFWRSSF